MSSDDLGLFSYEILALVGRGGASAHDLRRLAQEVRMVAWAGESQYYVEPKRLARLGYLEARKAPGRTRERTVYTLTGKGREAIRDYARTPARFTPFKSDALLRLLLADLGGEGATRASLAALRGELAELEGQLDAAAAGAEALPHRARYLGLAQDFLRRLIELHRELIDEVERELAPE
jgi:DNA-binding PadR family transcriptional regulator